MSKSKQPNNDSHFEYVYYEDDKIVKKAEYITDAGVAAAFHISTTTAKKMITHLVDIYDGDNMDEDGEVVPMAINIKRSDGTYIPNVPEYAVPGKNYVAAIRYDIFENLFTSIEKDDRIDYNNDKEKPSKEPLREFYSRLQNSIPKQKIQEKKAAIQAKGYKYSSVEDIIAIMLIKDSEHEQLKKDYENLKKSIVVRKTIPQPKLAVTISDFPGKSKQFLKPGQSNKPASTDEVYYINKNSTNYQDFLKWQQSHPGEMPKEY